MKTVIKKMLVIPALEKIIDIKRLLLIFFIFTANSNAQSFQWGASGGGTNDYDVDGSEQIRQITTDNLGNVYGITTVSNNGLVINGVTKPDVINTTYPRRSALVSYSCDGTFRWSKILNQVDGGVIIASVKTDAQNNVYITGNARAFNTTLPLYFTIS